MTERVLGPTGSPRRRWTLLLPLVAAIAVGLFQIAGAGAVHELSTFELDGNATTTGGAGLDDDWDRVCHQVTITDDSGGTIPDECASAANTTGATAVSWSAEPDRNATIFHGGGSKDPQDISDWLWKDGAGGLPDKDNLLHSFAARYTVPQLDGTSCPTSIAGTTCDVLYFGSDRFDNSGDAVEGFWFLQNKVGADGPASQGGFEFTGVHKPGDLLVLSDFSNGGDVSTINVYQWVASGGDTTEHLDFLAGAANALCAPALVNDAFCGLVNPGTITMPWSFTDKSGTPSNGALNGEFFEAGINLSSPLINLGGICFTSFLSETRASTSPTATLKDFVLGGFGACEADIDSTQTWVPNDSATVTVTGAQVWQGDVTFKLYPNTSCTAGTEVYTETPLPSPNVTNADPTVSTSNPGAPSPGYTASASGSFAWGIHFESGTTGVEDEDTCIETTTLTIDNDTTTP